MNPLATAIKTIIESPLLELVYLRTININDLNEQVGNVDLSAGAGIYTSTPQIDNLQNIGGTVIQNYSLEVYFLKLNPQTDDKGEAIDVILDELKPKADAFYDQIIKDPLRDINTHVEGYQLDSVETLKLSKEVLTGWRLRMILPIDRKVFFCIRGIDFLIDSDLEDLIDLDEEVLLG